MVGLASLLGVVGQAALLAYCSPAKYPDESTVIRSPKRWLSLPPTPSLPSYSGGKYAKINNIQLWYDSFGPSNPHRSPIFFLHGGLGNSDYFGEQVQFFNGKGFKVVTVDSRGHGRSTTDFDIPLSYDLMSEDFVALLDYLHIPKASFVGWSDGAINALNIAAKHPSRVDKVFAFAANYNPSGVMDTTLSPVFSTYVNRTILEYNRLSLHPDRYDEFLNQILQMWQEQPNWTESFFSTINATNVWIVDGDHEEAVYRSQQDDMARWLPDAGQLLLPQVSHFAFIQDPDIFNAMLWSFLGRD
ncbi:hypothetical protein M407DRAFT_22191 [Tulasnella calospora MUT 4182]|uniref:AB hydrolase-1 domain-containing protein n=1 Tax=Tulasnella calospora MUT 4182 TaxID=1051891 RepID=A0A0C3QCS9_9AGAM|nr:hypothetical protein M407DRAFT_22191 [Tulasnella calospora MUT 4182]